MLRAAVNRFVHGSSFRLKTTLSWIQSEYYFIKEATKYWNLFCLIRGVTSGERLFLREIVWGVKTASLYGIYYIGHFVMTWYFRFVSRGQFLSTSNLDNWTTFPWTTVTTTDQEKQTQASSVFPRVIHGLWNDHINKVTTSGKKTISNF